MVLQRQRDEDDRTDVRGHASVRGLRAPAVAPAKGKPRAAAVRAPPARVPGAARRNRRRVRNSPVILRRRRVRLPRFPTRARCPWRASAPCRTWHHDLARDPHDDPLKRLHLANARRICRGIVERAGNEAWGFEKFLDVLVAEEVACRQGTRLRSAHETPSRKWRQFARSRAAMCPIDTWDYFERSTSAGDNRGDDTQCHAFALAGPFSPRMASTLVRGEFGECGAKPNDPGTPGTKSGALAATRAARWSWPRRRRPPRRTDRGGGGRRPRCARGASPGGARRRCSPRAWRARGAAAGGSRAGSGTPAR